MHPGIILAACLSDYKLDAVVFAEKIGVSVKQIRGVLAGWSRVDGNLALRFGLVFDTTPQYWMNLQTHHEMTKARKRFSVELDQIQKLPFPEQFTV